MEHHSSSFPSSSLVRARRSKLDARRRAVERSIAIVVSQSRRRNGQHDTHKHVERQCIILYNTVYTYTRDIAGGHSDDVHRVDESTRRRGRETTTTDGPTTDGARTVTRSRDRRFSKSSSRRRPRSSYAWCRASSISFSSHLGVSVHLSILRR